VISDLSWLANVNNPIAMTCVISALFIVAVLMLSRQFGGHTNQLVNKFIDRSDTQNDRLVDVVSSNTSALEMNAQTTRELVGVVRNLTKE